MKVKCIYRVIPTFDARHQETGNTPESEFSVEVGKVYAVHGILLWHDVVDYLIVDRYDQPSFIPSDLFIVEDNKIPCGWVFKESLSAGVFDAKILMGYEEFVQNRDHYEGVFLRRKKDLTLFFDNISKIANN